MTPTPNNKNANTTLSHSHDKVVTVGISQISFYFFLVSLFSDIYINANIKFCKFILRYLQKYKYQIL